MSELIGSDHPLNEKQQSILTAFLNVLIPPGNDGRLPGAGEVDLREFMDNTLNAEFDQLVQTAIEILGDDFGVIDDDERETRVTTFNTSHPETFAQLYLQALAVYYRQDTVLRGIGSGEGPPFPRGNEVADGDMSLLDPVIANPKSYRPI